MSIQHRVRSLSSKKQIPQYINTRNFSQSKLKARYQLNVPQIDYTNVQTENKIIDTIMNSQVDVSLADINQMKSNIIQPNSKDIINSKLNKQINSFNKLFQKIKDDNQFTEKGLIENSKSFRFMNSDKRVNNQRQQTQVFITEKARKIVQNSSLERRVNEKIYTQPSSQDIEKKIINESFNPKNFSSDYRNNSIERSEPLVQQEKKNFRSISTQKVPKIEYLKIDSKTYQGREKQYIITQQKMKEDVSGLIISQSLQNFNFFEDYYDPKKLVAMYKDQPGYHAECPQYTSSHGYYWQEVQVVDYDERRKKYLVKSLNGEKKIFIGKISLLFKHENQKIFLRKYEQVKAFQKQAYDDIKFYKFVIGLSDEDSNQLSERKLQNILYYVKYNTKDIEKELLERLIVEIKENYKLFTKKFIVLMDVQSSDFRNKFNLQQRSFDQYQQKFFLYEQDDQTNTFEDNKLMISQNYIITNKYIDQSIFTFQTDL